MGKLNVFVHLNAYKDSAASNNPSLNAFKWSRDLQGLTADKPQSIEFCLAPGESRTLFDGQRALSSDNTTELSLLLKPGTSNTYVLRHIGGTAPNFRTLRTIGSDATTEVTVTVSGSLATFQATGGTIYSMASVNVGDEISIGTVFAPANQGRFKVLAKTADSFTVENTSAIEEGPIVLGVDFADEIRAYSSAGVQIGDKVKVGSGFNTISQGTYEATGVQDNLIEFYSSSSALPADSSVVGGDITVYSSAKKLIYLETDKPVAVQINNSQESNLEPFIESSNSLPGILLKRSTMWSLTVTNNSTDMATLYFASIE